MKGKVVVVGSSNTDMVVQMPSLPTPGETVLGGEFVQVAGGKGANQAVAAARLGAAVTFVARVGDDALGALAIENFQRDHIRTEHVRRDPERPSGVALIMVDGRGENMIAVASGANNALSTADVDAASDAISTAAVLLLQLETPIGTVKHAARLAKAKGATVILNPAPAQKLDRELLQHVSVLTPNEKEAEALTGILPVDLASASRAAEVLQEQGVGSVVITMGERGAFVKTSEGEELVPGKRVKAVDTTAAGDAFNGAIACALANGVQLGEAVRFANHVAALSVTRMGAQPSLPTLAEVNEFKKT